MGKAVLSNRIYLSAKDLPNLEAIKKALTYKIPLPPSAAAMMKVPFKVIKTYNLKGSILTIPSGRLDLIPPEFEIVDKRAAVPALIPFTGTLRPSQKEIYDKVVDNCIINAPPSWGKTFTACAVASKLGMKTLIVLHTTILRDQWAKEIKKVTGITPGVIGSGKFNIDAPIVVSNTQTLYKVASKVKDEFGTIILDEMHHVSSRTVSEIVDTMTARYKIGLSATINKKNGEHVVFTDYFSREIYKAEKENSMKPKVIVLALNHSLDYSKPSFADKVTELMNNPKYLHIIKNVAKDLISLNHKILIPMSRTEGMKALQQQLPTLGLISGEVKDFNIREKINSDIQSGSLDGLIATQSIVSEGYSNNVLSALILANPLNDPNLLEQLIGRIIRIQDNKQDPIIVDLKLCCPTGRSQFNTRLQLYQKEGYELEYISND